MRRGIRLVDGVEKDDSRFAGMPGCLHQVIKDDSCGKSPHGFGRARVDEGIGPASVDRIHETVGQADREIEVRHLSLLLLQRDEVENVRMVDPQDAHIGPASGSPLFDDIGGHVEDAHERDRAGREAARGGHTVGLRPEVAERESCAPTGLVDEGLAFNGVEDRIQRIVHRQDKAGRELLERPACVHQCGRIRQKRMGGHQIIKPAS